MPGGDKKTEARTFRIGPLSLGAFSLLSAVTAVVLYLFEILKRWHLDLPVALTMDGFDVLDTAIRNTFLIAAFALFSLVLFVAYFLFLVAATWTIAMSRKTGQLVLVASDRRAKSLSFHTMFAVRAWYLRRRFSSPEHSVVIFLNRAIPLVGVEEFKTQKALGFAKRSFWEQFRYANGMVVALVSYVGNVFWTWDDKSKRGSFLRVLVLLLLCWGVADLQQITMAGSEVTARDRSERYFATEQNGADAKQLSDNRDLGTTGILRRASSGLNRTFASVERQFWRVFGQEFRPGTVTLTSTARSATHLPIAAPSRNKNQRTLQSDPIFYIGDFGSWALLAPIGDIERRVLIRRSSIYEFTPCSLMRPDDPASRIFEQSVPLCSFASQRQPEPEEGPRDEKVISELKSEIARTRRMVSWWFRHDFEKPRRAPQDIPEKLEARLFRLENTLPALREAQLKADASLALQRERLAAASRNDTIRTGGLWSLKREMGRLRQDRLSLERDVAELAERTARWPYQNQHLSLFMGEQSELQRRTTALLEALNGRIASANDRISSLVRYNRAGWQTQPRQTLLRRAFSSDDSTTGRGEVTWQIDANLSDLMDAGVISASHGVVGDFARHNRLPDLLACQASADAVRHYVDFDEGEVVQFQASGFVELVKAVREMMKQRGAVRHLVLLRGGASYVGDPARNLKLSEQRAETVAKAVLRTVLGKPNGEPTELARRALTEFGLDFVAFGLGERLQPEGGTSPRAVEVIICVTEPKPVFASAQNGLTVASTKTQD